MKTAEEFLREICPNHTDGSKWNKSELLTILDKYQALQLLQPDVIKSVCKHEYITDADWKSLTCRLCNDRIKPTQTVL